MCIRDSYCSSEPNSIYQSTTITKYLEDEGYTVKEYTFSDSNDVAAVTQLSLIHISADAVLDDCSNGRKIRLVDSLNASLGQGLLAIYALSLIHI